MKGLKYILQHLGISYDDLGAELGVSKQNISSWTSGDRPIPNSHISYLVEKLKVSEEFLKADLRVEISYNGVPIEEYLNIKFKETKKGKQCLKCNEVITEKLTEAYNNNWCPYCGNK